MTTTGEIDTNERHDRLDWMRAEFRAAQQRRYETRRHAAVKEARVAEPNLAPDGGPPILATPSQ
jgi:hypothetical protein